MYEIIYVQDLY